MAEAVGQLKLACRLSVLVDFALHSSFDKPMRNSLCLISVAVIALLLSCSPGADQSSSLTWWQFWTSPEIRPLISEMAADFEKQSGTKVELGDLTWSDGHEKIAIGLAAGNGPDVVELGSDWIAEFADGGRLLDLSDLLGGLRDSLTMWDPAIYRGKVYAIPWMLGTRVLFCNRSLLTAAGYSADAVPQTWPELLEMSQKVDALGEDVFGFGSNSAERHRLYKKYLPFFWSAGGEVFNIAGNETHFNSEAGKRSLEFYLQLSDAGLIETQARIEEYFVAGKVGFVISGEWLARRLREKAPAFDYFATTMPADTATGIGVSFVGGEYLAVNSASANPEAAVAFLRHLVQPVNDERFTRSTGSYNPVNRYTDFRFDPALFPEAAAFQSQIRLARSTPVHPHWVAVEEVLERGLEQAIYKKASVSEALAAIDRECAEILLRGHVR